MKDNVIHRHLEDGENDPLLEGAKVFLQVFIRENGTNFAILIPDEIADVMAILNGKLFDDMKYELIESLEDALDRTYLQVRKDIN